MTYAEALDVALCWGWIDGLRKSFDSHSFLQRFTPRRPRSAWSQVNRDHVSRLAAAGRMQPPGLQQVERAKADGRWDAAYPPIRETSVPDDLMAAISRNRKALATFGTLDRRNHLALAMRLAAIKTERVREARIREFVAMLAEGATLVPIPVRPPRRAPKAER